MVKFLCILLCASVTGVYCEVPNQDTYINALENSHQTTNDISRNSVPERGDISVHASQGYDYHPHQNYGPPAPVYGPPKPLYGPPLQQPFYGHHLAAFHHPRDEHWFFDKFKFKLNLFTIGKILLKLIIFKKIIKFVALICLLLFLPKLKNLVTEETEEDVSMERRSFSDKDNLNERIHEISEFALTALETFSKKYEGCNRDQIWCRFQRMFNNIDHKYSYNKIVKLYIPNAQLDNENTI